MSTEILGTANLAAFFARSGLLEPHISEHDRGLSWDGNIEVFSVRAKQHRGEDLIHSIPIQVKAHRAEPGDSKEPRQDRFSLPVSALKHYRGCGGTLFFKVCLDSEGTNPQVWYLPLLPGDVEELLAGTRPGQLYRTLRLEAFPAGLEAAETILRAFARAMEAKGFRWRDFAPAGWTAPPAARAAQPLRPMDLYLYDREATGFYGREKELDRLTAFLRAPGTFRWWALVGPGGSGKSRLVHELRKRLLDGGEWDAAALGFHGLKELAAKNRQELHACWPWPTLLIVDYSQQHADSLREILRALSADDLGRDPEAPLRLLLLERDLSDEHGRQPWLEALKTADRRVGEALYREDGTQSPLAPARPLLLEPLEKSAADPLLQVIKDFAACRCAHPCEDEGPLTPLASEAAEELLEQLDKVDLGKRRPLYAMLLADARVHDPKAGRWAPDELMLQTVAREENFIRQRLRSVLHERELPALEEACLLLWQTATVLGAGGLSLPPEGLGALLERDWETLVGSANTERRREFLADRKQKPETVLLRRIGLLAEDGTLAPLRPDLPGERFVLDRMENAPETAADFFSAILSAPAAALTFFLRVLRDYPASVELRDKAGRALGYRDWFLPAGLALEEEPAEWLVWLLKKLFEGAPLPGPDADRGGRYGAKTHTARAWLADRIAGYAAAMPEDSVEAAHVFHNLADTLRSNGDYPKALEFCQKALAIKEKVHDPEHLSTATTYNNLALVYQDMGDYPKALEFCQKALAIREKVLSPGHPDTAATYNILAGLYQDMGDYPKAIEYFERALAIVKKTEGPEHPHTAATCNNLAGVYWAMGDYPKAIEFFEKALAIVKKTEGPEHPHTATTYNNLAAVYQAMGDFPKALEFYQKDLAISEKVLGPEHPDTATTYNNLAGVYHAMGDYPKAIEFFERALAIVKKSEGPEHPHTAATCNNLAEVYRAMGNYPKALKFHQEALPIREKVLGPEHPDTAATYNNLALVYHAMGDYPKAIEYFEKALAIVKKTEGPEHPHTAATYNNLASVYRAMGDCPKAIEYFEKALAIVKKTEGPEHPHTAATYNNLASVYQDMGDCPKALEFLQKALTIHEKLLGPEHPDTATTCNNIGVLYLNWRKPTEALPWLRRAHETFHTVLGPAHPNTKIAREALEFAETLAALEKLISPEALAELQKRATEQAGQ